MYNALKSCVAFVAASVLCFLLSVPCFAVDGSNPDVSAELSFYSTARVSGLYQGNVSRQSSVSAPFYGSNSPFSSYSWNQSFSPSSNDFLCMFPTRFELTSTSWFSGVIGLYCSFYATVNDGNVSGSWSSLARPDDYQMFYIDHLGVEHITSLQGESFSPASSGSSVSPGLTFKASVIADQASPVSAVGFSQKHSWSLWCFYPSVSLSNPTISLVFPSCTVVVTSNSEELAALESMADNIAAQNQILSQYYGQIVQVCNQIYQRLGDLQAAQEEANRLFSNVISLLNTTNGKIEAINMAMSTYFELLINQLKQEGIDTRTAIADAEARLETYLKPMIDYFNELEKQTGESASTLPGHKQDIDGFNNQGFGIDSDGQTGVAALVPILSAFGWIWSIIALFIGVGLIHILVKKGIG
jgi:hypothetical protein|nr:MAG TPA: hypothetical protein [Inoviridae sp.]